MTILTHGIAFVIGLVFGAWVEKHPEDARSYAQAAGEKIKTTIAHLFRRKGSTSSNG